MYAYTSLYVRLCKGMRGVLDKFVENWEIQELLISRNIKNWNLQNKVNKSFLDFDLFLNSVKMFALIYFT